MRVLRVDNVTKRFGGLVALRNVTMEVNEGEILGLIGPNGAGKTTSAQRDHRIPEARGGKGHLHGEGHHGAAPV
jgi:branched-chain amino acid transport system ATP-binding protein